jgi:hypothetical protein
MYPSRGVAGKIKPKTASGRNAMPTFIWIDGTNGNWGDPSNWTVDGVAATAGPTAFDNALISGSGTETVLSRRTTGNRLTLADANATLAVTNGAELSAYGGLTRWCSSDQT